MMMIIYKALKNILIVSRVDLTVNVNGQSEGKEAFFCYYDMNMINKTCKKINAFVQQSY